MKIIIGICAAIAVAVIVVLTIIGKPSAHASLTDPALVIDQIRGDRLGMTLKDYESKHPYECNGDMCVGAETYAGLSATKGAFFTSDGKLWKITYTAEPWESEQMLAAVEEKYGRPPDCIGAEGTICRWSNGKRSIRFSRFKTGLTIDFTDEALSDQASAEYNAHQAKQRKSDQ